MRIKKGILLEEISTAVSKARGVYG